MSPYVGVAGLLNRECVRNPERAPPPVRLFFNSAFAGPQPGCEKRKVGRGALQPCPVKRGVPEVGARVVCCRFTVLKLCLVGLRVLPAGRRSLRGALSKRHTTLSGGSLGSCVDEERSQLRELM